MRYNVSFFGAIFLFIQHLSAQTPDHIIKQSTDKFIQVRDFKSNVVVEFNIPSINLPSMSGKVFYRAPEKYKVKLMNIN